MEEGRERGRGTRGSTKRTPPPRLCSPRVPAEPSRAEPGPPPQPPSPPRVPVPAPPQPPRTLAFPASSFFSRSSSSMAPVQGQRRVTGGGRRARSALSRGTQPACAVPSRPQPASRRRQRPRRGPRRRHLHLHVNTRPGKVTWGSPAPPPAAIPPPALPCPSRLGGGPLPAACAPHSPSSEGTGGGFLVSHLTPKHESL